MIFLTGVGIIARLASIIADEKINIDAVFEEPHQDADNLAFVISVKPTTEKAVTAALARMEKLSFLRELPLEKRLPVRARDVEDPGRAEPVSDPFSRGGVAGQVHRSNCRLCGDRASQDRSSPARALSGRRRCRGSS